MRKHWPRCYQSQINLQKSQDLRFTAFYSKPQLIKNKWRLIWTSLSAMIIHSSSFYFYLNFPFICFVIWLFPSLISLVPSRLSPHSAELQHDAEEVISNWFMHLTGLSEIRFELGLSGEVVHPLKNIVTFSWKMNE